MTCSLALAALLLLAQPAPAAQVALHVSDATLEWEAAVGFLGDAYGLQVENVRQLLAGLGLEWVELSDEALEQGDARFLAAELLIMPGSRRMSEAQLGAIGRFVAAGGRLLVFYHSSLKTPDGALYEPYGFGLGELLRVEFVGWNHLRPLHGSIRRTAEHPVWQEVPEFVETPRNRAVVVRTLPGGQVLGVWYDDFRATASHPEATNAAVVLSEAGIYVGEALWVPELFADDSVRRLLGNMIHFLLEACAEPGSPRPGPGGAS
ncbi:hypothetical protein LIP_0914 [Limnochorda pilosa]|uniref:ThuA-like domain-containing protein n=1 Tax=Limnochorda pilosa TaxID=1555112 RepID=A0A0K2SI19_LIMPI|nr:hypothetical protein LIP_0914 [Limnochorda pilosa]